MSLPLQESAHVADTRHRMLALMSVYMVYEFAFVTMLGRAIGLLPILGGLLYFFGKVCVAMVKLQNKENRLYLASRWKITYRVICIFLFVGMGLMAICYPHAQKQWALWVMFGVVFGMMMREHLGTRLMGYFSLQNVSKRKSRGLFVLVLLLPMVAVGIMLIGRVAPRTWLFVMGGFVGDTVLYLYSLYREKDVRAPRAETVEASQVLRITDTLSQANAYRVYEWIHALILMALQLTLVLVVTFAGLGTRELFSCLMLLLLCTIGVREATVFFLRFLSAKSMVQLLVIGLFLWIYGLFLLYQSFLGSHATWWYVFTLCLGISGMTISIVSLCDLENHMYDAAVFTLHGEGKAYEQWRMVRTDMVILIGQVLAFGLLCLLSVPYAGSPASAFFIRPVVRPLLLLPILLLLLGALLGLVRFPVHNRHFQKLAHFLILKKEGQSNPALEKHLQRVVIQKRKNRFGILILKALFRFGYRYEVIGAEKIAGIPDGQMIFVCNHGEIYGPVAATLYTPAPVRPWGIAEMMRKEAIVDHIYYGTMVRQKWLPDAWKRPLVELVSPFLLWLYDSLEGIAVYRNNPKKLMQTFRETIEAMQAGDNILLFPENGEVEKPGDHGYVSQGVGKLYAGFATIAQLYYAKTKKSAVFVPLYASKKKHTFHVGDPVTYDPAAHPNAEKERIVSALLAQMQAFAVQAGDQMG